MRYLENIFEQVEDMIQGMQDNGENTTQATVLMDLSNFNLFQHGCAQCVRSTFCKFCAKIGTDLNAYFLLGLPVFFYDMKLFSYNYVGFAHKVICVNSKSGLNCGIKFYMFFNLILIHSPRNRSTHLEHTKKSFKPTNS